MRRRRSDGATPREATGAACTGRQPPSTRGRRTQQGERQDDDDAAATVGRHALAAFATWPRRRALVLVVAGRPRRRRGAGRARLLDLAVHRRRGRGGRRAARSACRRSARGRRRGGPSGWAGRSGAASRWLGGSVVRRGGGWSTIGGVAPASAWPARRRSGSRPGWTDGRSTRGLADSGGVDSEAAGAEGRRLGRRSTGSTPRLDGPPGSDALRACGMLPTATRVWAGRRHEARSQRDRGEDEVEEPHRDDETGALGGGHDGQWAPSDRPMAGSLADSRW